MLDSKDLELLRSMMQEVVGASEARMTAKIDGVETRMAAKIDDVEARMTAKIDDVETRMTAKIDDVEARMTAKINDVETRMTTRIEERVEDTRSTIMAYLESAIEPKLRLLAEGHRSLQEGKASNARVDRLEEELHTVKTMVMILSDQVADLKKQNG